MRGIFHLFLLLLGMTPWLHAELAAPLPFTKTKVLPQGLASFSLTNALFIPSRLFTETGANVSLGSLFEKEISWQTILSELSGEERILLEGYLRANDHDLSASVGKFVGSVEGRIAAVVPSLAVGLTSRWTLAVAIPLVFGQINVASGFQAAPAGEKFIAQLTADDDIASAKKFSEGLNNGIQKEIASYGYAPLTSVGIQAIADVHVVSLVNLWSTDRHAATLRLETVLPTGVPSNPDKLLEIPTGDGQWDFALGLSYDWLKFSPFVFSLFGQYVWQKEAQKEFRIPTSAGSPLSHDKETILMDLGDQIVTGMALGWTASPSLTLEWGYQYQQKGKDHYEGVLFSPERYEYLERDKEEKVHAVLMKLEHSTVPLVMARKFPVPLLTSIGVSWPFLGQRALSTPVGFLETIMVF